MKFTFALLAGIASANRYSFEGNSRTAEIVEPETWETYVMSNQEKVQFLKFTAQHGKNYSSETEFSKRAFQWHLADSVIAANTHTFSMAHNKFSDWTDAEKDDLLSLKRSQNFDFNSSRLGARNESRTFSPTEWLDDDDDDLEDSLEDYYEMLAEGDSYVPELGRTDCDDGYYYHRRWRRCRRCASGCAQCTSRRRCTECENEEMTNSSGRCVCPNGPLNDDGTCGDSCQAGQYFHERSGRCRNCGWNCTSCQQWYECEACGNGFTIRRGFCYCASGNYGDNFECLGGECDDDQYRVNDVCTNCPANCATCEDETGTCTECKSGYQFFPAPECVCPPGSHDTGSECITCADGQYWTGTTCSACGANCALCADETGVCNTCQDTFIISTYSTTECECEYGKYNNDGVCIENPDCGSGFSWNSAQNICQPCFDNCAECEDYTFICEECNDPSYWINGSYCQCTEAQFDNGSACVEFIECPDGQYVDYTTNTCNDCGENCVRCTAGTGACEECVTEFVVDRNNFACYDPNSIQCVNYGPVNAPVGQICEPYSDDRLIPPFEDTVAEVDWRSWGLINEIRDQSSCGSCWAFMAAANAENQYAIKYGPLYELSEQQLVSCDSSNYGCNGGWPTDAFNFWKTNGVIDRAAYPYTNDEATCYQDQILERLFYTDSTQAYIDVAGANLAAFKAALRLGSVGVAFGVNNDFMYYNSGIFTGGCSSGVNHGMVAVGFGFDAAENTEYAIIRNSWGTSWGEAGYARVKMGSDDSYGGVCDMYLYPNYPVIAENDQ